MALHSETFSNTAQKLSRNPLGIIALFIVLVYGIAGLILGLRGESLNANQKWPLVIFFVGFPAIVLCVFYRLVSKYPLHLYAPYDVKDEQRLINYLAPKEIRNDKLMGVTSDSDKATVTTKTRNELIEGNFPQGFAEDIYLVHVAQIVRPPTGTIAGLFRVRVTVEADDEKLLEKIDRVIYRLHPTFKNRIIATEARDKEFELWLNVYGEFTIVAKVERKGEDAVWLTRYLDLPGRPKD